MDLAGELYRAVVVTGSVTVDQVARMTKQTVKHVQEQICGDRNFTVAELVVIAHALEIDWRLIFRGARDRATK